VRRLRVAAVPLAVASLLAAPLSASAADSLGAGGVVIPGSALRVGVSGAAGTDGSIEARFASTDSPLYWGSDPSTMNDQTAAMFGLKTPTGLYSPNPYSVDSVPFTQTAPRCSPGPAPPATPGSSRARSTRPARCR
jgi:hypothetical protein